MVIRDIGLHMSNRVMDYCSEDASLCRGALEAQKGPHVSLTKTDFASVQEYLESSHFVQASAYRVAWPITSALISLFDTVRYNSDYL